MLLNKKNIILSLLICFFICISGLFLNCCTNNISDEEKINNINTYLENKYHKSFTFLKETGAQNNDVELRAYQYQIDNIVFEVFYYNKSDKITDCYQSVLFDNEMKLILDKKFQNICVSAVYSKNYTDADTVYKDLNDYINNSTNTPLFYLYFKNNINKEFVSNNWPTEIKNGAGFAGIIGDEDYNECLNSNNYWPSGLYNEIEFNIQNGKIYWK